MNFLAKRFAILTCGGVCPGMNDVTRSITLHSYRRGVNDVFGVKYGFKGLNDLSEDLVHLKPSNIKNIHNRGGSYLGTSREPLNVTGSIQMLDKNNIDALFIIGGNGGNTAAAMLHDALQAQGSRTQVIGLPKSIDNDIDIIDKCFGFETAVDEARHALFIARNEAEAVHRGVMVVNLMGRDSGFIAYHASQGGFADICLIPEVPLEPVDIARQVESVLLRKKGCVICMAEGFPLKLTDVCERVQQMVKDVYVKSMDPSYMIRGGLTSADDHEYCNLLGVAAVEAALEGKSGVTVATKEGKMHLFDTRDIVKRVKKVIPHAEASISTLPSSYA